MDIVERLEFDAARCGATFSKGVATNIEEAISVIKRLRAALTECRTMVGHPDNIAFIDAALRPVEQQGENK